MSTKLFAAIAVALAVGLATAASPYASSSPDGLERVAADKAFIENGRLHSLQERSPLPDYAFPGVQDARVATGLAGFLGVLGVFVLASGAAWLLRGRRGGAWARSATTPSH